MAVEISLVYEGELHVTATHGPSQVTLQTDAPVDNRGKGESFSPTDLVATALGCCMLTLMGIAARDRDLPIEGATVRVFKEMIADPYRRIASLRSIVTMPRALPEKQRTILERAALTCPVHQSLSEKVERPVEFVWPES
jgi:putative redox protein